MRARELIWARRGARLGGRGRGRSPRGIAWRRRSAPLVWVFFLVRGKEEEDEIKGERKRGVEVEKKKKKKFVGGNRRSHRINRSKKTLTCVANQHSSRALRAADSRATSSLLPSTKSSGLRGAGGGDGGCSCSGEEEEEEEEAEARTQRRRRQRHTAACGSGNVDVEGGIGVQLRLRAAATAATMRARGPRAAEPAAARRGAGEAESARIGEPKKQRRRGEKFWEGEK